ncbi:hypothetical protein Nisw_01435 [Candidatus Nitrosopumilus sp. SW]|uniref:hypothetical protein n=1 Tax=Candidatus Nitrosopumilus sp. SW TaxID=2508726 RepID=UPI001150CC4A|nr:hypothetical protein [Candidatus Nitrosopumilus sp. SW]QDI88286.1 hypothetical protein Nisw_01435 [Candidatus Nitrosopumilus sp. SW]
MNTTGLYMLNTSKYTEEKIKKSMELLYEDRKNEFRELSKVFLGEKELNKTANWKGFVLNFCLDVGESFKTWTGQLPLTETSPQKALTILRQVSNGLTSMNQLMHILNVSYMISVEFNEIYKRLN